MIRLIDYVESLAVDAPSVVTAATLGISQEAFHDLAELLAAHGNLLDFRFSARTLSNEAERYMSFVVTRVASRSPCKDQSPPRQQQRVRQAA